MAPTRTAVWVVGLFALSALSSLVIFQLLALAGGLGQGGEDAHAATRELLDEQLALLQEIALRQQLVTLHVNAPDRVRHCNASLLDPELRTLLAAWPLRARPARVIDTFLYNGEWRMLRVRLAELGDTVEHFVLIESTTTFTNHSKRLRYPEVRDAEPVASRAGRVRHHVMPDFPAELADAWAREDWFRNQLRWALPDARDDDLVFLSDADEVPDANVVECLRDRVVPQPFALHMWAYYYSYEYVSREPWLGTRFATFRMFREQFRLAGAALRPVRTTLPGRSGWHCSYCFPIADIIEKLQAFSHTEYSAPPYTDPEYIYDAIVRGARLFGGDEYRTRSELPHALPRVLDVDEELAQLKLRITDPRLTEEQLAAWKRPLT